MILQLSAYDSFSVNYNNWNFPAKRSLSLRKFLTIDDKGFHEFIQIFDQLEVTW